MVLRTERHGDTAHGSSTVGRQNRRWPDPASRLFVFLEVVAIGAAEEFLPAQSVNGDQDEVAWLAAAPRRAPRQHRQQERESKHQTNSMALIGEITAARVRLRSLARATARQTSPTCGLACLDEARPKGERSLAEREGFEPPEPFRVQWFSRPPPSTTRPSLRMTKSRADAFGRLDDSTTAAAQSCIWERPVFLSPRPSSPAWSKLLL